MQTASNFTKIIQSSETSVLAMPFKKASRPGLMLDMIKPET